MRHHNAPLWRLFILKHRKKDEPRIACKRIRNMRATVLEDGIDLRGYTTWGPIDLVAFSTGQMSKRYGFIYVGCNDDGTGDLHRVRKDGFYWYQKVIGSNGANLD